MGLGCVIAFSFITINNHIPKISRNQRNAEVQNIIEDKQNQIHLDYLSTWNNTNKKQKLYATTEVENIFEKKTKIQTL